jgi:site-specific recombinase XerD
MNLLEQFLSYCETERGYSPNTIQSYRYDLRLFRAFLGRDIEQAGADDIRRFLAGATGVQSPSTVARKFAAVNSFFRFAIDEEAITDNPAQHIRAPKIPAQVVRTASNADISNMLGAIGRQPRVSWAKRGPETVDVRGRALLMLAFGSGLRISEMVHLKLMDVDLERGVLRVTQGKGSKDRIAPMNHREIEAVRLWIKARSTIPTKHTELFISAKNGKPLSRQRLFLTFKQASLDACGHIISPHKFRHAFCSALVNGGADIRAVQSMLGHCSLQTTRRYLHSDTSVLDRVYQHCHPRGNHD